MAPSSARLRGPLGIAAALLPLLAAAAPALQAGSPDSYTCVRTEAPEADIADAPPAATSAVVRPAPEPSTPAAPLQPRTYPAHRIPERAPAAVEAGAATACPSCTVDFAIYDPDREEDGVWEDDVTALISLLDAFGYTWQRVDAAAIERGVLGSGSKRRFRAILEPGGWAWSRNVALSSGGHGKLRSFLKAGGGYVGFCAGAFYAASTVKFDLYGYGWYSSYPYQLRLFDGTATGPFGWIPWNDGKGANFAEAAIDTSVPAMRDAGLPARTRFLYGGGPWFTPKKQPAGWEVWARAVALQGATNKAGDGQPAIVKFDYGKGPVVLFAYHPEVLIHHDADGVTLKNGYDEDAIYWIRGNQSFDEIALDSWNVVHAALQVAAGWPVTPVTQLP